MPQPDREVLRRGRGRELLDLRIRRLDATAAAVALDFESRPTAVDREFVVDGFVRVEGDGLFCKRYLQ